MAFVSSVDDSQHLLCLLSLQLSVSMKVLLCGVSLIYALNLNLHFVLSLDENETTLNTTINPQNSSSTFRLPSAIVPTHYDLKVIHILDDDPKNFTAPGKVWINLKVLESTDNITLHAEDMQILGVNLTKATYENENQEVETKDWVLEKENSFLIVRLESGTEIEPGEYILFVQFIARIAGDRLNGLYLDYYYEPSTGKKSYIATTLFAPHHARKAFPCFDEPGLRATFSISIGHKEDKYFSLSNMEAEEGTQEKVEGMEGYVWTKYATTPSQATYIIAMITCDLSLQNSTFLTKDGNQVKLQAYAPSHLINYQLPTTSSTNNTPSSLDYSLEIMEKVMPFFETYFGQSFPVKKLAAVSLPHFYFSAMENWGLITFKDPVFLNVPNVTSHSERARISDVVNHELSHQIFGNLVGISFWNGVWLKEGFSTFYSALATELTHPELNPWKHFTTQSLQVALNFDEGMDSHPLNNEIKNSSEIAEIYTRIPYQKGASFLRMVEAFMGPESFIKGVRLYVERNKYKAASKEDLFAALKDADSHFHKINENGSGVDISEILESWTNQSGFPLLSVKPLEGNILRISQEKFVNPHVAQMLEENSTDNASWWIPVTFSPKIFERDNNSQDYTDVWIPKGQSEIFIDYNHTQALFLVNPSTKGYYRVFYNDSATLARIQNQLMTDHTKIPPVTRSQLLDDQFSLAFAKYQSLESALNMTLYLDRERDLVVWTTALSNFNRIENKLRNTTEKFRNYILSKIVPAWNAAQNDDLTIPENARLNSLLYSYKCLYSPQSCLLNRTSPDEQETTFSATVVNGSDEEWQTFSKLYSQEEFSVQKYRYLKALTCTRNASKLETLLNWTLSPEMHDVDKVQLVKYVAENPLATQLLLPFLKDNFNMLNKNVSVANPVIEGIKALVPYLTKEEDKEDVLSFIPLLGEGKSKGIQKEVKKVQLNILWLQDFREGILKWVDINNQGVN